MKTFLTHHTTICRSSTVTAAGLVLFLSTLVSAVRTEGGPAKWIPSQAVSEYSDFTAMSAPLLHQSPGIVANYTTILWGLPGEGQAAIVQLDQYSWSINLHMGLIQNAKKQVVGVQVRGLGGPVGGPWWYHETNVIPCTPVDFKLATGFTIHIHQDTIPVYRHSSQKSNSPRVAIAGYMALGDIVITPRP